MKLSLNPWVRTLGKRLGENGPPEAVKEFYYSIKRFLIIFIITSFSFGSLSAISNANAVKALSLIFFSPDFL
jgi:hypothetical protein